MCIAQFTGTIESLNRYFKVTGTHVNPNVTAMFLAMASVMFVLKFHSKLLRWIKYIIIILVLAALFMLRCRTAWLGLAFSAIIFLSLRYDLAGRLKARNFRRAAVILFVIVAGLLVPVAASMYNSKKASADGRKTVWKVTAGMIAEKPLTGFGYGNFEQNYNLRQAAYFEQGKGTPEEISNASFVRMAYNEPLENMVEGGLAGSALFGGVLLSLIIYGWRQRPKGKFTPEDNLYAASVAAIAGFIVMSLVNFTMQAIPVLCLFLIYAAVVSVKTGSSPDTETSRKTIFTYASGALLFISAAVFAVKQSVLTDSHLKLKKASLSLTQGKVAEAEKALMPMGHILKKSESYFLTYGNLYTLKKDYSSAAEKLQQCLRYTSDPEIYSDLGWCYEQSGNILKAEENYRISMNMVPNRFNPRFRLMQLYEKNGDSIRSIAMAKTIVEMKPKVKSKEVSFYKSEAAKLLRKRNLSRVQKSGNLIPTMN